MEEKDRKNSDEKIYNNLIGTSLLKSAGTVLCYASAPTEVDTGKLILRLLSEGKTVAVPRCEGKEMRFYKITALSDLRTGALGVPEPIGGDEVTDFTGAVCVTPALSISRDGYRLGYGGGFYDRFFEKHDVPSVGLCYESFIGDVPVENFDRKVNVIVTENEVITVTEIR